MKVAKFDRHLWSLFSFENVSYDKNNNMFIIYLIDGNQIEFAEVEEEIVFQFVISSDKEQFIKSVLLPNYPYIQVKSKQSRQSKTDIQQAVAGSGYGLKY